MEKYQVKNMPIPWLKFLAMMSINYWVMKDLIRTYRKYIKYGIVFHLINNNSSSNKLNTTN